MLRQPSGTTGRCAGPRTQNLDQENRLVAQAATGTFPADHQVGKLPLVGAPPLAVEQYCQAERELFSVSLWKRTLLALGLRKDDDWVSVSGDRLIIRDVSKAKTFPQEPKQAGPTHMSFCDLCRGPLRKVVFTTAGTGPQAEVWREYPLVVDGWICTLCGWSVMPRFITPDESAAYGRHGAEHAAKGEFGEAEFWFRRIIGSWPGYPAGYADLGQLMSARADAARDLDNRERYRHEALHWFERAIEADPGGSFPGIRTPFARLLALTGDEEKATELLKAVLARKEVSQEIRTETSTLLADIREGKSLFTRATEIMKGIILEPPAKPLSPAARAAMERGRTLLVEASNRKADFPTLFFLGKSELRLRNWEAARAALLEAHKIDPDQADGCRELAWATLELERTDEALPLTRRALELRPGDPGLQCNLAVVLLLTGDVQAAREAAEAALALDPQDSISKHLLRVIDEVATGQRQCPRSLAQLEGRQS